MEVSSSSLSILVTRGRTGELLGAANVLAWDGDGKKIGWGPLLPGWLRKGLDSVLAKSWDRLDELGLGLWWGELIWTIWAWACEEVISFWRGELGMWVELNIIKYALGLVPNCIFLVERSNPTLTVISQRHYGFQILSKYDVLDSRVAKTPMDPTSEEAA